MGRIEPDGSCQHLFARLAAQSSQVGRSLMSHESPDQRFLLPDPRKLVRQQCGLIEPARP